MPDYDDAYRAHAGYFGEGPAPVALRVAALLAPRARVLDVGVGQGRNALPLARRGHAVVGIDPSPAAVEATRGAAAAEGLAIEVLEAGVFEYAPDAPFDAVLVLGLLQVLSPADQDRLLARARAWLAPGGLLALTAWHDGDPAVERLARTARRIGPRAFALESGELRVYLAPGELRRRLDGLEVLHYVEGLGPLHRHGDGPEERHGEVEAIARLPA